MSDPTADFELGYRSAVRLVVAPQMTLAPASTPFVIEQLRTQPPVTGRVDNLVEAIPCSLEWLFSAGGESSVLGSTEKPQAHPRRTLAVPVGGGKFEVRERDPRDTASRPPYRELPLVLDAIEMGWIGEGKLGYRITLELLGNPALTISPSDSQLQVRLPVKLKQDWRGPRGTVRTVGDSATLGVGPIPWASGVEVRLEVAEYVRAAPVAGPTGNPSLVRVGNSETVVALPTTVSYQAAAVGYHAGGRLQGEVALSEFLYHRRHSPQTHVFAWRCGVSRPAPASNNGRRQPVPQVTWSEPQILCEVAHPVLESLRIGRNTRGELAVDGRFAGFAQETNVDLEVDLYGIQTEKLADREVNRISRLPEMLGRLDPQVGTAAALRSTLSVSAGEFKGVLMRLAACKDALEHAYPGLHLFAAVRFLAAQFGEREHVVFQDCASYSASTELETHSDGLAPFSEGVFSHPSMATAVCTQQMDLSGTTAPLVVVGGLSFAPNSKAVRAYRESDTGKLVKAKLRRKFTDEAQVEPNALRKAALIGLSQRFGDRFALYRAAEEVTRVSWEIIAVLHITESTGDAAPLHVECGFGLDAAAHESAELERRLQKYVQSSPSLVKLPFVRGGATKVGDIFLGAIVAADIYRDSAIAAKAIAANGDRTPIEVSRMSGARLACAAAAYNAGPASPAAANGLSSGSNYQFNLGDDDFRTVFPGGKVSSADGSSRVDAASGRSDGHIRWDVLLPSVQDWATALTVAPLQS